MFYIAVITGANLIIALKNALLFKDSFTCSLCISITATVFLIAIDGLSALLIRLMPESWFSPDVALFSVGQKERSFYKKIGVKHWKHLVPELGLFTGFHKDKLQSTNNPHYLKRFILESNYGVIIHLANGILGFIILLFPFLGGISIALPSAFVNLILSIMPIIILRFNTPILMRLYKKVHTA